MTFTSTTIKELRALGLGQEMEDRILEIFERANVKKPKKGGAADKVARGTRLAEDWKLPDEWRQLAIGIGLRPHEVDREAGRMRDWSRSSPKGIKLDWKATWRNWCILMLERAGRPVLTPAEAGPASPAGPAGFSDETWRAIAKRVKGGAPWNQEWGPPPGRMDCLMPVGLL